MSPWTTYLLETLVTLVGVVALAVLVLWGARRMGLGRPSGPLQLVGRLPLDARRSVYLVRVADRVLVLGASEAGLTKLGEMPGEAVAETAPEAPLAFSQLLARVRAAAKLPRDTVAQEEVVKEQSHG